MYTMEMKIMKLTYGMEHIYVPAKMDRLDQTRPDVSG